MPKLPKTSFDIQRQIDVGSPRSPESLPMKKREDYVRKYIGLNMDYLEYLKSATTFNDELKKTYDAIEKFLKENLMRF